MANAKKTRGTRKRITVTVMVTVLGLDVLLVRASRLQNAVAVAVNLMRAQHRLLSRSDRVARGFFQNHAPTPPWHRTGAHQHASATRIAARLGIGLIYGKTRGIALHGDIWGVRFGPMCVLRG